MSLDHSATQQGPIVYTINEFCDAHRISRSKLYQCWDADIGPRFLKIGAKILITTDAAAEWRAEREAASNPAPA